jgi:hypothetical protein
MPIPAGQYRPSNLTKQQRQEQLAAIYGVSMPLTETEIARMRQLVLEHDSQAKKATIHDLNNPPKEQYRFQKFPMVVYDHQSSSPARMTTSLTRTALVMPRSISRRAWSAWK